MKQRDGSVTQDFLRWDGMNRFIQQLEVPFSELRFIVNYHSDLRFAKKRRSGYTLFLDTPDSYPILAIIPITKANGTGFILRVTTHGVYKYIVGSGATSWGAEVYTFPNLANHIDWAFFYGTLYLCTGTNNLISSSDGSTYSVTGISGILQKNPNYVEVFQSRLALINDVDNATSDSLSARLRLSRIGDATNWTNVTTDAASAQFFDIDVDHNGAAQDLFVQNNRLVIPKGALTGEMSMYRFDGDTMMQVPTDISMRPGGFATAKLIDGLMYFTNNDGIFEYAGNKPVLKSLSLNDINVNLSPVAAGVDGRKYLVALGSSLSVDGRTLANPIIVFDQIANEFFLYNTAHRMVAFASISLSASESPKLYSGDSNGNVYVWDGARTDNGTTIHGEIETRPFFGSSYISPKDFSRLWMYTEVPGAQRLSMKPIFEGVGDWTAEREATGFVTELEASEDASNCHAVSLRIVTDTNGDAPVWNGVGFKRTEGDVL